MAAEGQNAPNPTFLMVALGQKGSEGGLGLTNQVGYHRQDRNDLLRLATQMDTPDLGFDTRSIPDAWGHMLSLQQALIALRRPESAKNPVLLRARAQWRGLLTLVVLRRELGLEDSLAFHALPANVGGARFLAIVERLLPDQLTAVNVGWRSVHALSVDGMVVGCTSPLTFVCPAASTPAGPAPNGRRKMPAALERCPWFSGGRFEDPVPHLEASPLKLLHRWLEYASEVLAPTPSEDELLSPDGIKSREQYLQRTHAVELRGELKVFREEIEKRLSGQRTLADGDIEEDEDSNATFHPAGRVQECLRHLLYTSKDVKVEHVLQSPYYLQPAPDAPAKNHILLVDESFRSMEGSDEGKRELLRGLSLSRALEEYEEGVHDKLKSLNITHGTVYRASELFTKNIFLAPTDDAFPGAWPYKGVSSLRRSVGSKGLSPILPLSKAFVGHFTPKYLTQNVEFTGSEGEITVSINIQLNLGKRPTRVSRTYRRASGEIVSGRMPEVKVWPAYDEQALGTSGREGSPWKAWYAYFNDHPAVDNKLIVAPQFEYLAKVVDQSSPLALIKDTLDPAKRVAVHRCDAFPRIFECTLDGRDFGILLTHPAEVPRGRAGNTGDWEVSIDFGTTGTSVFRLSGTADPPGIAKFRLASHVLGLTKVSDSETYRFFLPTDVENEQGGILSLFHDFEGQQEEGRVSLEPLLGGNIAFLGANSLLDDTAREGICADMKWGSKLDQLRGGAFLTQLCLMTALQAKVEGAQAISWVFSYPLSFTTVRLSSFLQVWDHATRFAITASGMRNKLGGAEAFRKRDESACAAMFVRTRHYANLQGGAVVLDIGGGSTDISVWANPEGADPICARNASLKFAGRDIFQRPLKFKAGILTKLIGDKDEKRAFVDGLVAGASNEGGEAESIFFSKLDSLFRIRGRQILANLSATQQDEDVRKFIDIVALGMQGLFFFAGLTIKDLCQQGMFRHGVPDLYVCGNGGRVLDWLNSGKFREGCPAESKLLSVFRKGAGLEGEGVKDRITLSDDLKAEAAYGMLVDPGEELKVQPWAGIAGESFRQGETQYGAFDPVPYAELTPQKAFRVTDELPMVGELFAATGRRPLSPRTRLDVVNLADNWLTDVAKQHNNHRPGGRDALEKDEQPIFVGVMNALIKQAAVDWKTGRPEVWWH